MSALHYSLESHASHIVYSLPIVVCEPTRFCKEDISDASYTRRHSKVMESWREKVAELVLKQQHQRQNKKKVA
jgi:hypothetical protein